MLSPLDGLPCADNQDWYTHQRHVPRAQDLPAPGGLQVSEMGVRMKRVLHI